MKICILSDLYLEINNIEFNKLECEVLILAGNIGPIKKTLNFIKFNIKNGVKIILYIMGNHEFYDRVNNLNISYPNKYQKVPDSYTYTLNKWKEYSNKIKELYVLDNTEFVYKNVRFLGTTLWSNFYNKINNVNLAYRLLNDYRFITYKNKHLTPHNVFNFHLHSKNWLENKLKNKNNLKTIVISHYLPSNIYVKPFYPNDKRYLLYTSNLNYLFDKYKIDFWIHGHQKIPINIKYKNTNIISNPRGYYYSKKTNPFFNYNYFIDI